MAHPLRDRFTFLLGQSREDCCECFAGGLRGVDVLLLKVDADVESLQFPYSRQTFLGVPGEAGDGFNEDAVDFSTAAILHHPLEVLPLFSGGAGDALVCIDIYKRPIRIAVDELCEVSGLGGVGVELVTGVRADAGVCRYPEGARVVLIGGRDDDTTR